MADDASISEDVGAVLASISANRPEQPSRREIRHVRNRTAAEQTHRRPNKPTHERPKSRMGRPPRSPSRGEARDRITYYLSPDFKDELITWCKEADTTLTELSEKAVLEYYHKHRVVSKSKPTGSVK